MRRLSRRLWTFSLSAIAVVIVLAALAVGVFRVLVAAAPGYRHEVAQWISRAAGRPVHIGRMDLVWSHWEPTLDLDDVTLMRADGSAPMLHLRRVRVGFPLTRLLHGRLSPDRLLLVGPHVSIRRTADGRFQVVGLEQQKAQARGPVDWRDLLEHVSGFAHLRVRDAQVRWLGSSQDYTLHDINLTVHASAASRRLRLTAALPDALGERVTASAVARGPLQHPAQVTMHAVLSGMQVAPWLKPYLRPDVDVHGDARTVELSADWRAGHIDQATAQIAGGGLRATMADGRRWTLLQSLDFSLRWAPDGHGWRVKISRPPSAPTALKGELAYRQDGNTEPVWQLLVPQLPLRVVSPWLRALAHVPRWLVAVDPQGRLEALQARLQKRGTAEPSVTLHARFHDAGFKPLGRMPGLDGLSGEFSADRDGGELRIDSTQSVLKAPRVFDKSLPLKVLGGRLRWQRTAKGGWQINAARMRANAAGVQAHGQLTLNMPPASAPPTIDLTGDFSADSIEQARDYVPKPLPPKLRNWLRRSLKQGRVSDGHVTLKGPLPKLPFAGQSGQFLVNFQTRNVDLAYAPGWPAVNGVDAAVHIRGRSLHVQASGGQMLGVDIGPVTATIDDFRQNVLHVTGKAKGDVGDELSFLSQSPLRKRFQGLLQRLTLSGIAGVDVQLTLPLKDLHHTQVSGRVHLDGVRLVAAHWPHPVTAIQGNLSFAKDGVSGRDIRARMLGLPLTVALSPTRDSQGRLSTRIAARARLTLPKDAKRLQGLVPEFVLNHLAGQMPLYVRLTVGRNVQPPPIRIDSDLQGMAITLPAPLGKPAQNAGALTVHINPLPKDRVDVQVAADRTLSASLRVATHDGHGQFERGRIRLGGRQATLPQRPGLWIDGHLKQVDAVPWLDLFDKQAHGQAPGKGPAQWLGGADLRFDELTGYGQRWQSVQARLARTGARWMLTLDGPDAQGSVQWPLARTAGSRRIFDADFSHLRLRLPAIANHDKGVRQPIDPARWPGLRLVCRHCELDKLDLGQVTGEVKPVPDGVQLTSLTLDGQDIQGEASGRWIRAQGRSRGTLDTQLTTRHLGRILTDLGYAESITAQHTRLNANLAWNPSASGLGVSNLAGTLRIASDRGSLPAVDPGASRVLGLFNFYALPRRLSLNFRDVVGPGLAFDSVRGSFRFSNGNAVTDGMELKNPSMRMVMKGRIGLVAQDYDEDVIIHPQVGASLSIAGVAAGTVIGGPAVGALVFLAQQLFNKPLDEVSTIRYHLGGTWSNPKITKK